MEDRLSKSASGRVEARASASEPDTSSTSRIYMYEDCLAASADPSYLYTISSQG